MKSLNQRTRARRSSWVIIGLVSLIAIGCKNTGNKTPEDKVQESEFVEYNNPPSEGFDIEGSDPIAIMLADQVMNSMGGREKWDNTNVIYWNFFGRRTLLWDKADDRVRIDIPSSETVISLNISEMTGNVWQYDQKLEDPDSLSKYLDQGKKIWINDSYWLVMPFKLKDSGVTLKYLEEGMTLQGQKSDVLRLTFKEVGVTPQNAYEVWVDTEDRLIKQWAFYREATQEQPDFVLPWTDYQDYDGLLLSGERGDRDLTDIKVLKKVPKGAFDSPGPIKL